MGVYGVPSIGDMLTIGPRDQQSPGSSVGITANCRAFWRWLGFFNFYPEVGLKSAKFIG